MQKKFTYLMSLFLIAILVVGCNTEDKTEKSNADENSKSKVETTEKTTDTNSSAESEESSKENETTSDKKSEDNSVPEKEVTYTQKGENKKETAPESKSVDQGYKLHQLPGFTLSQEEPGKDILVSNADDAVFMRIETIDKKEMNYDEANTTLQEYMNAIGETSPLPADQLATFKDVSKINGYIVDFDTEHVIGIVFEKDDLLIKLIIHDNDEQDLTSAMLAMASTISKK